MIMEDKEINEKAIGYTKNPENIQKIENFCKHNNLDLINISNKKSDLIKRKFLKSNINHIICISINDFSRNIKGAEKYIDKWSKSKKNLHLIELGEHNLDIAGILNKAIFFCYMIQEFDKETKNLSIEEKMLNVMKAISKASSVNNDIRG